MLSCDQSLVTVAFLWEKLSQPQFYKYLTRKTAFFERWSWFKFNNLGLALCTNLKSDTTVAKGSKLKVRKFWEIFGNSYVCGSYRGKTGRRGGAFCPLAPSTPHLNRVKVRDGSCHKLSTWTNTSHWFCHLSDTCSAKSTFQKFSVFILWSYSKLQYELQYGSSLLSSPLEANITSCFMSLLHKVSLVSCF